MFLNKKFLLSLLIISLAICIAGRLGVSIEQIQFIFFPLILLHFILFPTKKLLRLPAVLAIFIVFLAYFSSMKTRGLLPSSFYRKHAYLVSNGTGEDRKSDRNFYNKFNLVAEHFHSRRMKMLFRNILDPEDLANLSARFSEITYLLSSEPDQMFAVAFPKNIFKMDEIVINDSLKKKAKKYNLDLEDKVSIIEIPELNLSLLLGQAPRILNVPAEPMELSTSYLFWLQKAVAQIKPQGRLLDRNFYQAEKIALEEDAAGFLAEINGAWRNPEPLAFAKLLFGTRMFLEYSRDGSMGEEPSRLASGMILSAIKALRGEKNIELIALARNNFAVSRFILANSANDLENSLKEMLKAVQVEGGKEIPTGARLALLNLELIKEAGY